jgi:hypothetical protein
VAVDALSRMPSVGQLIACSEVKPWWLQEVMNSYATDSHPHELLAQLAVVSPNEQGYSLHQ